MLTRWWAPSALALVGAVGVWTTAGLDGQPYQFVLALAGSILTLVVWATTLRILWLRRETRRLRAEWLALRRETERLELEIYEHWRRGGSPG